MRDRRKGVESSDFLPSESPCPYHPSSTPVGICPFCLKDRLIKLVCSHCGESRLCSCSCTDLSNRNSVSLDNPPIRSMASIIHNNKPDLGAEAPKMFPLQRSFSTSGTQKRSSSMNLHWFRNKRGELDPGAGRKSDASALRTQICEFDQQGRSVSHRPENLRSRSTREGDFNRSFDQFSQAREAPRFFQTQSGRPSIDLRSGIDAWKMESRLTREYSSRVTSDEKPKSKHGSKFWKWIFRHPTRRSSHRGIDKI